LAIKIRLNGVAVLMFFIDNIPKLVVR